MIVKYTGTANIRSVSEADMWKLGCEHPGFRVPRNGTVDIPDVAAERLIAGGGFKKVGESIVQPIEPAEEVETTTIEPVDPDITFEDDSTAAGTESEPETARPRGARQQRPRDGA